MPLKLPPQPRRRMWQTTYLLAFGAVSILALFVIVTYLPRAAPPPAIPSGGGRPSIDYVQIDGFDLILSYTAPAGSAPSYFDPPECSDCPVNATVGSSWQFEIPLTNADLNQSHQVTGIDLTAPFALVYTTPSLPVSVAPGATLAVTVHVLLPSAPGYYILTGSIDAT